MDRCGGPPSAGGGGGVPSGGPAPFRAPVGGPPEGPSHRRHRSPGPRSPAPFRTTGAGGPGGLHRSGTKGVPPFRRPSFSGQLRLPGLLRGGEPVVWFRRNQTTGSPPLRRFGSAGALPPPTGRTRGSGGSPRFGSLRGNPPGGGAGEPFGFPTTTGLVPSGEPTGCRRSASAAGSAGAAQGWGSPNIRPHPLLLQEHGRSCG